MTPFIYFHKYLCVWIVKYLINEITSNQDDRVNIYKKPAAYVHGHTHTN